MAIPLSTLLNLLVPAGQSSVFKGVGERFSTCIRAFYSELLRTDWDRWTCRYSLSREGEDWALRIMRDDPPAPQ